MDKAHEKDPLEPREPKLIVGNFQLTGQLPNGQNLTFNGYIMHGEGPADVDGRLDLFQASIERMRKILEIPSLEAALEQSKKALEQTLAAQADLDERNREGHLTSQEKQTRRSLPISIKHLQNQIEEGEAKIAARRGEVSAMRARAAP